MRKAIAIILMMMSATCFAGTIEVGPDKLISRLKDGIKAARVGDTILLYAGTYREGNIVINKPVYLAGIGKPVLDGEGRYEILTLTGECIVVKGIHFKDAGYSSVNDYAAISVIDAGYVTIENNTISNSYFAIHLANTTRSLVSNNSISGNNKSEHNSGNGIHLWKCDEVLIENNQVEGHRDGIYFEFVTNSIIQNNNSTKNIRYGLHFMFSNNDSYLENTFSNNGAGVAVMYSHHVLMLKNHFEQNWGPSAYGILLKDINDSRIYHNTFLHNTVSILMEGANRISVGNNLFSSNGWALKVQANCSDNNFHANNFLGNTFDVATNGSISLNHFQGNFWDKYEGYDLNRDGVGDVPYRPVSMYAMIIEQNPNSLILLRSAMVSLLEKAEKAIPSLTPANLADAYPKMKPYQL
jgi:nitrous oxidase accessory protein